MKRANAVHALPRRLQNSLVVLAALGVAAALATLFGPEVVPGEGPAYLVSIVTALVACGFCLVAARSLSGPIRTAWTMFALSMAMTACGDVLWLTAGGFGSGLPVLGVADTLYLGALVPALVGLLRYPVLGGDRGMWRALLVDAVVLVTAVLFGFHTLVLRWLLAADASPMAVLTGAIYPVITMLLAAVALLLILRTEGDVRLDLVLGGAALSLYGISGCGYALGNLPGGGEGLRLLGDLTYVMTPLVVAAAAAAAVTLPTRRRTLRRYLPGVISPQLPDLTALLTLALAALVGAGDPVSMALGVLVLLAVGLRQVSQTASGEKLRAELEHRVDERTVELDTLTEEYRRLDTMKLQFVTAVSHELRTPLAAIRGALEMLEDGDAGDLPPGAMPMVTIATRGSERLTRLVNDIIDLERLETGAFGFNPCAQPVAGVVVEAARSLDSLAREQEVEILVGTADGTAWCDPDRLLQVLVNLLGNALKFAPRGTAVTVEARRDGDHVLFSVDDRGRGIPPAELEAIFDRFHQVEMDDSRQRGGAGLGLTICRNIVERHGGRIWVESPGQGTTFWFTLPVADEAARSAPETRGSEDGTPPHQGYPAVA